MAVMNKMRQNTKSILLVLVFAFILTIIFSWGMGGFKGKGGGERGIIASVEGEDITYKEFYDRYQEELRAQRERTGKDPEGYQLRQIENNIFEGLIQQRLMSKIVQKIDLHATDEEILQEIYNHPPEFLQSNEAFRDSTGAFDMNKYQEALNNPAANWAPVENYMRMSLPLQKLDNLLRLTMVVTDDEARLEYIRSNIQVKINYIFYNASDFSASTPEPTEEEISAYYSEHIEDYRVAEKRVLDYIMFELKPSAADSESVRDQAQELLEEAQSGADFEMLARVHSQDEGSAEQGGDLGFFGKGQMVKPFEDAAFSAKIGEIVGPVESQFGVHIIKVEDRKREDGEWKVKARHILLKFETSPATREMERDEANYLAIRAQEKDSTLAQIAESREDYELQTTQPFEKEGFIPGIGMERRVNAFAFGSQVGDISDVIYTEQGFLVASLAEIIKAHTSPLEEVKAQIVNQLKADKRMELARVQCEAAFEKVKDNIPLDEVAQADSLEVTDTDYFNASAAVPGVGREPRLTGMALRMDIGQVSPPIEGTRGYYLIQVIDRSEFDEESFQRQKESIKQQLLSQKVAQINRLWYSALRERADIKDYRSNFL